LGGVQDLSWTSSLPRDGGESKIYLGRPIYQGQSKLPRKNFVVDALAPKFVVDALAPKFVVDALAPKFVVDALAPKFVVDALAPKFVVDALAT